VLYGSVEYRLHVFAVFLDAGSVWDQNTDRQARLSTGFGVHAGDVFFMTLGFPLNSDGLDTTFMIGVRF
jgi:hypothetical protein